MRQAVLVSVALLLTVQASIASAQGKRSRPRDANECSVENVGSETVRPLPPPATAESTAAALQELDQQRSRWRAQGPVFYRVCVVTFNPLHLAVRETDVRNGKVVTARTLAGIPGLAAADAWAPAEGDTVEQLFDEIEEGLRAGLREPDGPFDFAFAIDATYDATTGAPASIYTGPNSVDAPRIHDANVSTHVRITPSPARPLPAPRSGEAFAKPRRARIDDAGQVYDGLLSGSADGLLGSRIRALWPTRADAILERGHIEYWESVGWKPAAGVTGNVIGTFVHPFGELLYLMECPHRGGVVYVLIATRAVTLTP